jgi:hypothetical protein
MEMNGRKQEGGGFKSEKRRPKGNWEMGKRLWIFGKIGGDWEERWSGSFWVESKNVGFLKLFWRIFQAESLTLWFRYILGDADRPDLR